MLQQVKRCPICGHKLDSNGKCTCETCKYQEK